MQYRERYQEGYNCEDDADNEEIQSLQYRERYQEGYNPVGLVTVKHMIWALQYRERYQEGYNVAFVAPTNKAVRVLQYRERYQEGYNVETLRKVTSTERVAIPRAVSGGLQFVQKVSFVRSTRKTLQYRERYQEGYNTVPLSPWGYWPQMSKMENLLDFPAFSGLRRQALFAFCAVELSETLVL